MYLSMELLNKLEVRQKENPKGKLSLELGWRRETRGYKLLRLLDKDEMGNVEQSWLRCPLNQYKMIMLFT
jgi:hypothetical protein